MMDRPVTLDALRQPVAEELRTFDTAFHDAMRSRVGLVDLVARYLVRQKGKRVRPILVLLSAKACGTITDSTYRGATLIEILHTATLVHDDVVDDADTRRGLASINAVWKNKVAVLMGDYLLSRGLLLSLEHGDTYFLRETSQAVKRMSEGELLQIQRSRRLDIDEPTYLRIIADKTASLFSACTAVGAASSTQDEQIRARLREYGEQLGLAFQVRDDLLDYLGKRSILGKPTGIDIKERKLTLPLIHTLRSCDRSDARTALRIIRQGADGRKLQWVIDLVVRSGGIEYAMKRADAMATAAREQITPLPPSEARDALMQFVDFVVTREH